MITIGIDEVGRGCLAGPLVAGAVILPTGYIHDTTGWQLTDSKRLSARQRAISAQALRSLAVAIGMGWVTADEIDRCGMTQSVSLAMQRAVRAITVPYDEIIIDGSFNYLKADLKARPLVKADLHEPAVSAASIIAKVARDEWMQQAALRYPAYGFERHVGYGTPQHLAALRQHGATSLHRQSFAPVRQGTQY